MFLVSCLYSIVNVCEYFEYGSKGSLKCIWLVFVKFYLTKVALVVIETVSKSETKLTHTFSYDFLKITYFILYNLIMLKRN